jgi:hypothetical protein
LVVNQSNKKQQARPEQKNLAVSREPYKKEGLVRKPDGAKICQTKIEIITLSESFFDPHLDEDKFHGKEAEF